MTEHVYEGSIFWGLIKTLGEVANVIAIPTLFVAVLIWAVRERNKVSFIGFLGGLFILLAFIFHRTVEEVFWINISAQPTIDQNSFIYFFYSYGLRFGWLIIGLALTFRFWKGKDV